MAREIGPAQRRWIAMRTAAGFRSDRALERALSISGKAGKQVHHWIHYGQEPTLDTMRRLRQLLGGSLDALDDTIVSWRAEVEAAKRGGADLEHGTNHSRAR